VKPLPKALSALPIWTRRSVAATAPFRPLFQGCPACFCCRNVRIMLHRLPLSIRFLVKEYTTKVFGAKPYTLEP